MLFQPKVVRFAACAALCFAGAAVADTNTPTMQVEGESTFVLRGSGMSIDRASGPGGVDSCWWDNGASDGLNALQSQTLGNFNARAADDFILEAGRWHLTESIKVCMAVSNNVANPVVELELYADCNGKPGQLLTTFVDPTASIISNNQPFNGFTLYEFTFDWNVFRFGELNGCTRFWISPFGRGTGTYFWPTSNNGVVQGVQGQYRAPSLGVTDWTDGEDVVNFRRCTDFCFEVCAKSCYTIKDQGSFDLAGLSSIKFPNIELFDARAADNFQISPSQGAVEVCRIEAYLATNCDPTRVFAEISSNSCDVPGSVLYTLRDPEVIIQTGIFFEGLQVYCFRFDCPAGVVLNGGLNYWFSLAAISGGTIFDRAVFLFHQRNNSCQDVHITPGVYRNPFDGFDVYTPVSDPDLAGADREFAFSIYGSPVIPAAGPRPTLPGDANNDGFVNFQDIQSILRNWGSAQ